MFQFQRGLNPLTLLLVFVVVIITKSSHTAAAKKEITEEQQREITVEVANDDASANINNKLDARATSDEQQIPAADTSNPAVETNNNAGAVESSSSEQQQQKLNERNYVPHLNTNDEQISSPSDNQQQEHARDTEASVTEQLESRRRDNNSAKKKRGGGGWNDSNNRISRRRLAQLLAIIGPAPHDKVVNRELDLGTQYTRSGRVRVQKSRHNNYYHKNFNNVVASNVNVIRRHVHTDTRLLVKKPLVVDNLRVNTHTSYVKNIWPKLQRLWVNQYGELIKPEHLTRVFHSRSTSRRIVRHPLKITRRVRTRVLGIRRLPARDLGVRTINVRDGRGGGGRGANRRQGRGQHRQQQQQQYRRQAASWW